MIVVLDLFTCRVNVRSTASHVGLHSCVTLFYVLKILFFNNITSPVICEGFHNEIITLKTHMNNAPQSRGRRTTIQANICMPLNIRINCCISGHACIHTHKYKQTRKDKTPPTKQINRQYICTAAALKSHVNPNVLLSM